MGINKTDVQEEEKQDTSDVIHVKKLKNFEKYFCKHCERLINYNMIISHIRNHDEE